MKTTNKHYAIFFAASMLAAPNLFAAMNVTLDQGPYSYGSGGEFTALPDAGLAAAVDWSAYSVSAGTANPEQSFQTFCTELNEEFSPGGTYPVTSIGNNALYNGSPTQTPVPITMGVAYLYSQFAAGTLAGYDYANNTVGRSNTAGDLQNAIWFLLQEGGSMATWVSTDLASAGLTSGNWLVAANGAFGVADMTLGNPGENQDQLVMVPGVQLVTVPVPEASTVFAGALLLLPFGISAMRVVRKNKVA